MARWRPNPVGMLFYIEMVSAFKIQVPVVRRRRTSSSLRMKELLKYFFSCVSHLLYLEIDPYSKGL